MNPITSFDPSQVTSGTIDTLGINKGEQIVLYNSSLSCLQLEFADKTKDILPPCWARSWSKSSPMSKIKYITLFTLTLANQPISILYGTLYEPDEHVADVNCAIQYVYAVGNQGGIPLTSNTLTNTGNPPLSNVVTIQPNDAASATITFDNSGNVVFKSDNAGTLVTLLQLVAGSSPLVKIGVTVTLPNNVFINQATTGNIQTPLLGIDNNNNLILNFSSSGVGAYIQRNSSTIFQIGDNGTGIQLGRSSAGDAIDQTSSTLYVKAINGNLGFQSPNGTTRWSLSRMNGGTIACGSGTTISHGLGVTPSVVLGTPNIAQAGSATVGVGNVGSSTFQATVGAGSNIYWEAKAY